MLIHYPRKKKRICLVLTPATRQKRQTLAVTLPIIQTYNPTVRESDSHRLLGVTVGNSLSCYCHIAHLGKITSAKMFQMSKIKQFLNFFDPETFLSQAGIQSRIGYE